jgi:hypothetical protein
MNNRATSRELMAKAFAGHAQFDQAHSDHNRTD